MGTKATELDKLINANLMPPRAITTLPAAVLEDLRYFRDAAVSGRAIRLEALLAFLSKTHSLNIGRAVLHRLMSDAGVTPWFARK